MIKFEGMICLGGGLLHCLCDNSRLNIGKLAEAQSCVIAPSCLDDMDSNLKALYWKVDKLFKR